MIRAYRYMKPQKDKVLGGIHPYFEMLYVISGQMHLQWMGESYLLKPHSFILLYPNTPHRVVSLSAESSFWFIELDMEEGKAIPSMETCIAWNRRQSSPHLVHMEEPAYGVTLNLLTASICSGNIDASDYHKQMAVLDIQKLLLIIQAVWAQKSYTAPAAASDPSAAREAVLFLMRYMETEYSRPISLAAMSELTHFNPSYLIRIFKKHTGVTPAQYLQTLRLNAAVCFLGTTDLTVEEIALNCGYQSIHYFSQSFKRKLGESPTLWRKRMHNSKTYT